ncbi:MAG: family 43 glycosylhydrolase [Labilithrix sp.]|nr:family 43 glycosylhydrolase [Labilithrix sp.]
MRESIRHGKRLTGVTSLVVTLGSCTPPASQSAGAPDDHVDAGATSLGEDGGAPPSDASTTPDATAGASYTNPVFADDFPDPFVLRDGDRYYAFATNSGGKNVPVVTSTDLASWSELPDAMPVLPAWARSNASLTWAPAVLRRGSTFVLYFTARSIASGFQCIGRAIATSPAGPYVDDSSGPFVCQVGEDAPLCGSIDASPFVGANGDAYLLWKSDENAAECAGDARLWAQRLGVDGISLLGSPTELLRRDRGWEMPLVEGPSMLAHDGHYYLFYSAGWWESSSYAIGYAVCATPLGPCEKKTADGPLVKSDGEALGPGGQEFFTDTGGKTWMAYHGWSSPIVGYRNGGGRSLRIDPVAFAGEVPVIAGPTTSPRPL